MNVTYGKYGFALSPTLLEMIEAESGIATKGFLYLCNYGLKQSISDKIAATKAGLIGVFDKDGGLKKAPTWTKDQIKKAADKCGIKKPYTNADLCESYCEFLQNERWTAIKDGTVTMRKGGERLSAFEKAVWETADRLYRKKLKAKNIAIPSDDIFDERLEEFLEENRETIEKLVNADIAAKEKSDADAMDFLTGKI